MCEVFIGNSGFAVLCSYKFSSLATQGSSITRVSPKQGQEGLAPRTHEKVD